MKINPLVSVIIPTYNRAGTVLNSVNSVKSQTYTNTEIIVVDDGSVDETKEILKNIEGITYIYKTNGGQASARNEGLKHAKGEIISSLDSDDIWYPDFLEVCVTKLIADDLDFVFGNWEQQRADGTTYAFLNNDFYIQPYFKNEKDGWVNLEHKDLKDIYLLACPSPSSSLIIRKSSIAGGWNPEVRVADDWFMYLDVILSGKRRAAFTLKVIWKKCINDQNVYDGRKRDELLENLYLADFSVFFKNLKDRITPSELQLLENKHIYALLELAKHNVVRNFNPVKSAKLIRKAALIDYRRTFKYIPEIILFGFRRKAGTFKPSKNRPH